jgi:hypothetical protein
MYGVSRGVCRKPRFVWSSLVIGNGAFGVADWEVALSGMSAELGWKSALVLGKQLIVSPGSVSREHSITVTACCRELSMQPAAGYV